MLWRSLEALAQLGVLCGNANRAGVEVAGAHHDAAGRDQRGSREAVLVGAEDRGDRDVAAGLQLTVGLNRDPRAQVVEAERLLRLRKPNLPRHAGRVNGAKRRGACTSVVTGNQHVVGVGLCHAGGDSADADLRDQLDRHLRLRVGAAEVVDQLLEVLDRVDVVVRRRRDQPNARSCVANPADVLVDLVAWQLAALAGLRSLRHLDLNLVGVDEVVDRHSEAAGSDLLDRGATQITIDVGLKAAWVLSPFTRV